MEGWGRLYMVEGNMGKIIELYEMENFRVFDMVFFFFVGYIIFVIFFFEFFIRCWL